MNNQWFSKVAVWLVIALVLFTVFKQFERTGAQTGAIGYSEFLEEVRGKRIQSVTLRKAPAARPRSAPRRPTTRSCAPPPPTSTAAWSAT